MSYPAEPVVDRCTVVRQAFDLYAAGDVDSVISLYHEHVSMRADGSPRPPALVRGRSALEDYLRERVSLGANTGVRYRQVREVGDRVLVLGESPARYGPGVEAAWIFEFEGDAICRIEIFAGSEEAMGRLERPAAPAWAQLGSTPFESGSVAGEAEGGAKMLVNLDSGDTLAVPTAAPVVSHATVGSPVLVYLDAERNVLGWYLPDQQIGLDLRE